MSHGPESGGPLAPELAVLRRQLRFAGLRSRALMELRRLLGPECLADTATAIAVTFGSPIPRWPDRGAGCGR